MIAPRLALALALCATPVLAQDVTSSFLAPPSSSSSTEPPSSSEPAPPAYPSSSAPSTPAGLSDAELEMAVRAAYTAAAAFASAHGNYFARDGVVGPLRDAIALAVTAAYASVVVPADAFADFDAAKVCLATPGTELRLATNIYGDGVTLVAVTEGRVFAYDYNPHKAAGIKVVAAGDCFKPK